MQTTPRTRPFRGFAPWNHGHRNSVTVLCFLVAIAINLSGCRPAPYDIFLVGFQARSTIAESVTLQLTAVPVPKADRYSDFWNFWSSYDSNSIAQENDATQRLEFAMSNVRVALLDAHSTNRSRDEFAIGIKNEGSVTLTIVPEDISYSVKFVKNGVAISDTGYPLSAVARREPHTMPKTIEESLETTDWRAEDFTLPALNAENRYIRSGAFTVAPGERVVLSLGFRGDWRGDNELSIPIAWPSTGRMDTVTMRMSEKRAKNIAFNAG